MNARLFPLLAFFALISANAFATIFGSVRGIVHDPQHRPLQGAMVMLRSNSSDWAHSTNTNDDGEFAFNPVPIGDYTVVVAAPGVCAISLRSTRVVGVTVSVGATAAEPETLTDSFAPATRKAR